MGGLIKNKRIFTAATFDLESDGGGVSLVTNDDKIKSLIAGSNITIIDNGNGTITINGLADDIVVVTNYSSLPDPTTVSGQFYWASNSEGTAWDRITGNYRNAGLYYSNGVTWEFIPTPVQATLAEVNTGTNNDKFVTPNTLSNSDWAFTSVKVLATLLSGLSVATGGTIVSTDSVLVAFGKLQNQITTLTTLVNNNTRCTAEWYSDSSQLNPADASVYCNGLLNNAAFTNSNIYQMTCTKTGAVYHITWEDRISGTLASNEGSTIRVYNVTQGTNEILTTNHLLTKRISASHMRTTLAFTVGDMFYVEKTHASWATNPTVVYQSCTVKEY